MFVLFLLFLFSYIDSGWGRLRHPKITLAFRCSLQMMLTACATDVLHFFKITEFQELRPVAECTSMSTALSKSNGMVAISAMCNIRGSLLKRPSELLTFRVILAQWTLVPTPCLVLLLSPYYQPSTCSLLLFKRQWHLRSFISNFHIHKSILFFSFFLLTNGSFLLFFLSFVWYLESSVNLYHLFWQVYFPLVNELRPLEGVWKSLPSFVEHRSPSCRDLLGFLLTGMCVVAVRCASEAHLTKRSCHSGGIPTVPQFVQCLFLPNVYVYCWNQIC